MFRNKRKLSALEWEIMEIIWAQAKAVTVREVLETAYPEGEKAYTTVQTVMNNLVDKGFLEKEKTGLVNFYTPVALREQALEKEVRSFVNRSFGGSLNALVSFMLDSDALSAEEIRKLKQLIDAREKGEGEA